MSVMIRPYETPPQGASHGTLQGTPQGTVQRPLPGIPHGVPPKIDFDAAGGVDLDRLARSLELQGERVGDGRYHVTGGSHDHWVDLYSTAHPRCDCGDHLWREQICKHILAALLREGNDRVVGALGALFARLRGVRRGTERGGDRLGRAPGAGARAAA